MKRFKIAFFALLGIIGYVGAAARQGTIYHRIAANNYSELDPSLRGSPASGGWNCVTPLTPTCTYQKINAALPISDANAERAEAGTFVQNP